VCFFASAPGFYEDGKFGCRIKDIVRIVMAYVPNHFKVEEYLTFETVSLVPIQTKMLLPEMLTEEEVSGCGCGCGCRAPPSIV
jgi:Xaa-Pro aminopeptidase